LAWLLPLLVRVNFWQQQVSSALSAALNRPVKIGDLHLRVIGGIGFEASNVSVAEDSAFGAEPFARAESLRARVALSSLWRGRLEFSAIDLTSPSINVVRNEDGLWNLAQLGAAGGLETQDLGAHPRQTDEAERSAGVLPRLRVESGRINFKSGYRKKAYRVESLELELIPPASTRRPWRFQLEGTPTRTDLPFHPTSHFEARGEFGPVIVGLSDETGIPLHVDWNTESAMLAELLTAVAGQDFGIHGEFNLRGHAAGTTSLFRVSAQGEIDHLHRWDLLPTQESSSLRAELVGVVDIAANWMELTSLSIPMGSGAMVLHGRIEDVFSQPRPRLEAELRQVPLNLLARKAPQFTTMITDGVAAAGDLNGHVSSDGFRGPLSGTVQVGTGWVQLSGLLPRLEFDSFQVILEGSRGSLGPLRAVVDEGSPAEISVKWDAAKQSAAWRFRGQGISLPAMARVASIVGWSSRLAGMHEGTLEIDLDVATGPASTPRLSGWVRVSDAVAEMYGVQQPLRIQDARFQFQPNQLKVTSLSAGLGPVDVTGNAVFRFPSDRFAQTGSETGIEFTAQLSEADIAEVAAMLAEREAASSFLNFGRSESPQWTRLESALISFMSTLSVRGTVRTDVLHYGPVALEDVAAAVSFRERELEVPDFSARIADGAVHGNVVVDFSQSPPSFTWESSHTNVGLSALAKYAPRGRGAVSGNLSGVMRLKGSGRTLAEILAQLSGEGEASGTGIVLRDSPWAYALSFDGTSEARISSFTSAFQIEDGAIHISEMILIPSRHARLEGNLAPPPATVSIRGDIGFNQRLDLTVQGGPEDSAMHWAGTLSEPRVSPNLSGAATARAISAAQRGDTSLSGE
jgi:uncharacterized protein involved in outer membrane biogenesis